jgi:hypothetical protein
MWDSARFGDGATPREISDSPAQPCDLASQSPECEREAQSLAERMTGIAPRPPKPRISRSLPKSAPSST